MNESRDKAYFLMSLTFLAKPSTSKQRIIIQVIRTLPSDNGTGSDPAPTIANHAGQNIDKHESYYAPLHHYISSNQRKAGQKEEFVFNSNSRTRLIFHLLNN